MDEVVHIPFETVPYRSATDLLFEVVRDAVSSWGLDGVPVAIKAHFGEPGSTRHLRPVYLSRIADAIRSNGGMPFCTDTAVLYRSPRSIAPTHLETAARHGFNAHALGCPVIIADGLLGNDGRDVDTGGSRLPTVRVASAIAEVRHLVVATHVTLHGFSGVGSAVKNLGMGCLARAGKAQVHLATMPRVDADACTACGDCVERCAHGAIALRDTMVIDQSRCTGCCHCMGVCQAGAIGHSEDALDEFCERLAEAALGVVRNKQVLYVNFLSDVTRQCDCASFTHPPVCRDQGIVVSSSLYAVERVTLDMLRRAIPRFEEDRRPDRILNVVRELNEEEETTPRVKEVVQ